MRNECEATSMARSLSGRIPPTMYGGWEGHNHLGGLLSRLPTTPCQDIPHKQCWTTLGTASYLDNISQFNAARLRNNYLKLFVLQALPLTHRSASCSNHQVS